MHPADLLRYILWAAVAATAARNRKEYGVPTAWLTHLLANTVTLFLPDVLALAQHRTAAAMLHTPVLRALLRTLDQRVRLDRNYVAYAAPLALGFIASHADFSIYHGRWAKRTILGFGPDTVPHATAAYALTRLVSETLLTLHVELPDSTVLARPAAWAAEHVDEVVVAVVALVTVLWEISEYLAHLDEIERTGRGASEVNMQWTWPDAITDSLSNALGLLAAIAVRHARSTPMNLGRSA